MIIIGMFAVILLDANLYITYQFIREVSGKNLRRSWPRLNRASTLSARWPYRLGVLTPTIFSPLTLLWQTCHEG